MRLETDKISHPLLKYLKLLLLIWARQIVEHLFWRKTENSNHQIQHNVFMVSLISVYLSSQTLVALSKNTVCANVIYTSFKCPIIWGESTPMVKGCIDVFDMVDTVFAYSKALIICSYFQESSKIKESSLCVIWNAHTAFLLCGADINTYTFKRKIWLKLKHISGVKQYTLWLWSKDLTNCYGKYTGSLIPRWISESIRYTGGTNSKRITRTMRLSYSR